MSGSVCAIQFACHTAPRHIVWACGVSGEVIFGEIARLLHIAHGIPPETSCLYTTSWPTNRSFIFRYMAFCIFTGNDPANVCFITANVGSIFEIVGLSRRCASFLRDPTFFRSTVTRCHSARHRRSLALTYLDRVPSVLAA